MKNEGCALTWKAEALLDGRLDGADRTAFEVHVKQCGDCARERRALVAMSARLAALPEPEVAPLDRVRLRGRLLARANERFVAPRRRLWPAFALGAAVVATVAFAAGTYAHRSPPPSPVTALGTADEVTSPPRYDVTAAEHTMWRARDEGSAARVDLADGEASFHVDPATGPARFVLSLPDGEAESSGGRFSADVAVGRTRSVNVSEGHLVFRRRGEGEVTLHAGESWSRTPPPAATAPPEAKAAPPRTASSTVARPAPGPRFDEAIGSFVRGSYAQADEQLADFIARFPDDSRCEDAAFLRAVACSRMGDPSRARARAAAYLASYPAGLRRSEAQHIVDASP